MLSNRSLRWGVGVLASLALGAAAQAQVSQLVISEVFGGGHASSETPNADYVEIYNRYPTPISLNGLSVQVASNSTSSTWNVISLPNVTLNGYEYFLVQLEPDNPTGVDFVSDLTASIAAGALTGSNGKVALVNGTSPISGTGCATPVGVIDFVGYGNANAREQCTNGNAPQGSILSGMVRSVTRKDGGCADSGNNSVDFEAAAPTPQRRTQFNSVSRQISATVNPTNSNSGAGASVLVSAYLRDCGIAVTSATVTANLSGFGLPNLTLLDNGLNGDGAANDGVYARSFNVPVGQSPGDVSITVSYTAGITNGSTNVIHTVNVAPPVNDLCTNATDVSAALNTSNSYFESVVNTTATVDANLTCDTDTVARFGFWYTFTPATGGALQWNNTSAQDAVLGVFTFTNAANQCGTLNQQFCSTTDAGASFLVNAGTKYYILVANQTATSGTPGPTDPIDLTLAFLPAPPNDTCAGAIDITSSLPSYFESTDVTAATPDPDVSCNGASTATAGIWQTFVAPSNGAVLISETSSIDTVRTVFTGTCAGLTEIACSDPETLSINVTAGTRYWVETSRYSSTQPAGTFDISIEFFPPPGNDTCATATEIFGFSYGDTPFAPSATDDADVSCNAGGPSAFNGVWYRFTPSQSGALILTENSTNDVDWVLYTGSCGALTEVFCTTNEPASFPVTAGTQYRLMVCANSVTTRPTIAYDLVLDLALPPSNDTCAGATVVDLNSPFNDSPDGRGATPDVDVSCNDAAATSAFGGVWYTFTTGIDGGVLNAADTSTADVVWTLYTGACNSLSEVSCNSGESANFVLTSNTTYRMLLAVNGTSNPTVNYEVAFNFTPATGACCQGDSCQVRTHSECNGVSGTYLGDNERCAPPAGNPTTYPGTENIPMPIVDNQTATSSIVISDPGPIGDITVSLTITHTYVGDLNITLSDGINTVDITTNLGLSNNLAGTYVFSDSAPTTWASVATAGAVNIPPGTYQPETPLAPFLADMRNATWTLSVGDDAGADTGVLSAWSLSIDGYGPLACSGSQTPCQKAASYAGDTNLVEVGDLFAFLDLWFLDFPNGAPSVADPNGDFDDDSDVDVSDLFSFLDEWFAAFGNGGVCP